jgi:hypothetical protein
MIMAMTLMILHFCAERVLCGNEQLLYFLAEAEKALSFCDKV